MNTILTIFTPTYNRGYILNRLYNSLCNQTNKEFIWMIVDDGSSDNTREIVKQWLQDEVISIKYIKQENQGKHIAHNTAVENCDTELFFCVDSDDLLLGNAVQDIYDEYNKIVENNVAGILTIKSTLMGDPVGTCLPFYDTYCSLSDMYEKYRFRGDTSIVFKTDTLKMYKFPHIKGEKFVGEEYVYCQIDVNYKLYISNKKYYICEYLQDGYTSNMFKLIADNPKGYMLLKKMKLETTDRAKIKYKSAALCLVGMWLSKEKHILKNTPEKIWIILAYPLAILVYIKRFKLILPKKREITYIKDIK